MNTRREFVKGGAAVLAWPWIVGYGSGDAVGAEKVHDRIVNAEVAQPDPLRFGILSDIHVDWPLPVRKRPTGEDLARFKSALEHFREVRVDAVVIAGDMANSGQVSQLLAVGQVWDEVFPDDKLPGGAPVVKLFICGNHDVGRWKGLAGPFIADDLVGAWQKAFHEPYERVYRKTVKGVDFVCAHWGEEKRSRALIDAAGVSGRPFFYVQHPHPKDTVYWGPADRLVDADDGKSRVFLARWPQAVALSGHSHLSLADERSVWQDAFTSVGCGSLMAACRYGRENVWSSAPPFVQQMPRLNGFQDGNYLIATLYGQNLRLERWSSCWREKLGPDWNVRLPATAYGPYSPTRRTTLFTPPQFPPGSALSVEAVDGCDVVGVKRRQVVVSFPAAGDAESRVVDYDVRIEDARYGFVRTLAHKRVVAEGWAQPPSQMAKAGSCVFALGTEFPEKGAFRVTVTPVNSLEACGRPLVVERLFDFTDKVGAHGGSGNLTGTGPLGGH